MYFTLCCGMECWKLFFTPATHMPPLALLWFASQLSVCSPVNLSGHVQCLDNMATSLTLAVLPQAAVTTPFRDVYPLFARNHPEPQSGQIHFYFL
jgi:hypothetical protein